MKNRIIDWLRDHELISLNGLEKKLAIPQGTLSKAMKGTRPLPDRYVAPLWDELVRYGLTGRAKTKASPSAPPGAAPPGA